MSRKRNCIGSLRGKKLGQALVAIWNGNHPLMGLVLFRSASKNLPNTIMDGHAPGEGILIEARISFEAFGSVE
jgi:hypothetical protein